MKRGRIALNILFLLAIAGYLVVAFMLKIDRHRTIVCSEITVNHLPIPATSIITDSIIADWIHSLPTMGKQLSEIDLHQIEQRIREKPFIDSARVSIDIDGILQIDIRQATPLLRIKSDFEHDFLLDSTLKILPIPTHMHIELPIVTGYLQFGFPSDYFGRLDSKLYETDLKNLKNIANFVKSVQSDDFLRDLIVQIYVDNRGEFELVPRVGNQIILFGGYEEYPKKLSKLKKFYLNSFSHGWWATAGTVNVKYRDQVIVR